MPDPGQHARARSRTVSKQGHSPTREIRRESGNDVPPLFGLHRLTRDFTIAECNRDEKAALADLLHEMSQRTWLDLILGSRKGTGFEKIARTSINVGIPDHVTADVQILSIRLRQDSRLIGFRQGQTFYAIWVDTKHQVYKG